MVLIFIKLAGLEKIIIPSIVYRDKGGAQSAEHLRL
jgi:hypothetical protein